MSSGQVRPVGLRSGATRTTRTRERRTNHVAAEEKVRGPGDGPDVRPKSPARGRLSTVSPGVFYPAAAIIIAFVLYATIFRDQAKGHVDTIQSEVVGGLGWYYTVIVSLFVIFAIWVGVGRYGDIRLGRHDDTKPEFGLGSWLAMLFAAGMGIGLVFWGVAEPLMHYASPRPGTGESEATRSESAMVQTFLHWGIHPWAIYVVVGLAVAYAVHRKGRPVSIRWALEPIFGDRIKGAWGHAIDVIAIVGTVFGVATSLGLGVLQISAGLDFKGWVNDPGKGLLVALIIGITLLAIVSVVTGVARGIKWLSNINMTLALGLMLFVLIAGPTLFILNGFVQDIGGYLQNILQLSFDTGASAGDAGAEWLSGWTVFYWGWWISWAPFVGIFIARISRGRTVREFVCGVLLVPTLLTFFWFSVFGGSALHREIFGAGGLGTDNNTVSRDSALFQLLDTLPGGALVAGVAMLLIVLFFVTSSDSGSYVVDMLGSGGDPDPPRWSRIFWAAAEGAVAIALLVASGTGTAALDTLQTTAILIALPFSIVMIGMCAATIKSFHAERQAYLAAKRKEQQERLIGHAVAAIEEGLENGSLSQNGGSDNGEGPDDGRRGTGGDLTKKR
ncbi:BCCT family transporter [Streptomyces sp. OF3]|uniref:BCCT family transporter n=1 Tax=Streptomyces alkaliterrae TaxID=2213162 RepID=A0A5P0YSG3_9ACTN|nr:BCCT family transporter [Streptomyces alkaliterrae]MBB1261416.1 BCCT family transporter [Streptomyces alkaliterrae]MQS03256.1 BCCT family transporter [Streptomyces alkaliterrae]